MSAYQYRLLADVDQHRVDSAGIFAWADPFDVVLRELSASYVEELWRKLEPTLATLGIAASAVRPGYTHPGYTFTEQPVDDPLSYFGWVSTDAWARDKSAREDALLDASRVLAANPPRLRWGAADVRAEQFVLTPTDFVGITQVVAALAIDEPSSWSFGDRADAATLAAEPWRAACAAWNAADAAALDRALSLADGTYSAAGAAVVRAAIARLREHGIRRA